MMNERSRSTLFLMEQIIVILLFSICAASCLQIFVGAYVMARDSRDTRSSLLLAQSAAESFKASGGELNKTATLIGGEPDETLDTLTVYYDKSLNECAEADSYYVLMIVRKEKQYLTEASITVSKTSGALLSALTTAGRRQG